jgi:hypothetical protein
MPYKDKEQLKAYQKAYHKKRYQENRESILIQNKAYRDNNKEKDNERKRRWCAENKNKVNEGWERFYQKQGIDNRSEYYLLSKYNLTSKEYNIMLESQNHSCAICKRHQSEFKRRLAVDHCHDTGKVRGLLCHKCNLVLGYVHDEVTTLNSAVEYLGRFTAPQNTYR